ncbi:ubiquitin carboxyl-terminal hydrolase domain containing protein [Entamoeba histolytica]
MTEKETPPNNIIITKSDLIVTIDDEITESNFIESPQYQSIIQQAKSEGCILKIHSFLECEQFSSRIEKIINVNNQTILSKSARKKIVQNKKKYEFLFIGGGFYIKCVCNESANIHQFGIKKIISFLDSRGKYSIERWLNWIIKNSMTSNDVFIKMLPLLIFIPDYICNVNYSLNYPTLKIKDIPLNPFSPVSLLPVNLSLPLTPNSFFLPFYKNFEVNCHPLYSSPVSYKFSEDFIQKLNEINHPYALQLLLHIKSTEPKTLLHPLLKCLIQYENQTLQNNTLSIEPNCLQSDELLENLTEQIYILPFNNLNISLPSNNINNLTFNESYQIYVLLLKQQPEHCLSIIRQLVNIIGNPFSSGIVQSLPDEFKPTISQVIIESIPSHPLMSNYFEESLQYLQTISKKTNLLPSLIYVLNSLNTLTKEELMKREELIVDFIEYCLNHITNLSEQLKLAFTEGCSNFIRVLYDFDDLTLPIAKETSLRYRIIDILTQIIQIYPNVITSLSITFKNCIEPLNYTPYNPLSYGIFSNSGSSTPSRSVSRSDLYSTISRSGSLNFNESYCESKSRNSKSKSESSKSLKRSGRKNNNIETVKIGNIIGIRNLGSTCYLNSILQQLYGDVYFRNSMLLIDSIKPEQPFLSSLRDLFIKLMRSSIVIDPRTEVSEMRNKKYGIIKPGVQRDACEMLMEILDSVSDELKGNLGINALKKSYLIEALTEIRSCDCSHNQQRVEEHVVLPLEIKGLKNLEESLEILTGTEYIGDKQYKCEECHKQINIKKQMFLHQLPNTLIFQLKRFDFNLQTFQQEKINSRFLFPDYINLRPFTFTKIKDEEYCLAGVIVHSGNCTGGHYTSYIKDGSKWFLCNDEQVIEVKREYAEMEWFGTKNKSGYLLFYRRITPLEEIPSISIKTTTVPIEKEQKSSKKNKKGKSKKGYETKFEIIKDGEKKNGNSCLSSTLTSSISESTQSSSIDLNEEINEFEQQESIYTEQYLFDENIFYSFLLELYQHIEICTKETVSFIIQIIMFSLNERRNEDFCEERKQLLNYVLENPCQIVAESLIENEINNKVIMTKRYCFNPRSTSSKYTSYVIDCLKLCSIEINQRYLYQLFVFYSTLTLTKAHVHGIKTLFGNGLRLLTDLSSLKCSIDNAVMKQLFLSIKQSDFILDCMNIDISVYYNFVYSLYLLFDSDVKNALFLVDLLVMFKTKHHFDLQKSLDFSILSKFFIKLSNKLPNELFKSRIFIKVYSCLDSFYTIEDIVHTSPLYSLLINIVKTYSLTEIKFIIQCLCNEESECSIKNHVLFTLIYDYCFRHLQEVERAN